MGKSEGEKGRKWEGVLNETEELSRIIAQSIITAGKTRK